MTKGELANRILKLLGVNTRFSDATPDEVQDTLKYAEDWLLSMNGVGKRLGYIQSDGEPDPNEETGLPEWSVMGVVGSVAQLIAPYFDKQPSPMIMKYANIGMQTIAARTVEVQPVQYPRRFPRGRANGSPWGEKFYYPADWIRTQNDFLSDSGDDPISGA